ncbi:MAG TPA: L-ribulose-5-phosphate 4-epimerase [Mobilitalea sp.]|nr:L-ribulose-5-phosphate 4-epimerase [Mobilitalea sp.]
MLEELKKEVYEANMLLQQYKLVTFTWGDVSGIDRKRRLVVIKPSGVEYNSLTLDDMVVLDLNGCKVEGKLNASSDALTHVELYNSFPLIQGIVHTHSRWATIFSQMGMGIPPLGTTHADYFHGEIPCTRKLRAYEIRGDYERETGSVIVERFRKGKISPEEMPGVLVCNHGPFSWGDSPYDAVHNAVVMEEVAFMAWHCMALPDKYLVPMQKDLLERHYSSKHGKDASYGQDNNR